MDAVRYETARLGDVDDTYYFGVSCNGCLRSKRLSLVRLRASLGADYPIVELRRRLKCSTCRSRQIVISFLAPAQSVGNLAYLFEQTAQ